MILIDSSVWIDYFRGTQTAETDRLDVLLGDEILLTGDLVLTEVLQGFRSEKDFQTAKRLLTAFEVISLGGPAVAIEAAVNFRTLRKKGVTIRKTIDSVIATCCIKNKLALLYSDRDFDPFVKHLGLQSAMSDN